MSNSAIHAGPHWTVSMRQQVKLLYDSRRIWLLIAMCTLPTSLAEMARLGDITGAAPPFSYIPSYTLVELTPGLLLLAALWPLLAWRHESWGKREYHWSLPVNHATHDLQRVLAGALWLMLGVTVSALVAFFFLHMHGGSRIHLPDGTHVHFHPDALFWLSFFTGPLIVYLFASILSLCLRRPFEWMMAIVTGALVGVAVAAALDIRLTQLWYGFINHTYGIRTALTAENYTKYFHFLADVGHPAASTFSVVFLPEIADSTWLISVSLWLGVAIVGVVLATRRRL